VKMMMLFFIAFTSISVTGHRSRDESCRILSESFFPLLIFDRHSFAS
jgi:hypothetical protein